MKTLQVEIQDLILNFRSELSTVLGTKLYGLYLYSSTARGEFEATASDIDFLVILNSKLSQEDIDGICSMHQNLAMNCEFGDKLDGMYLQKSYIGKSNADVDPYPVIYHAKYQGYGKFDINDVTWWSLKTDGIAVDSPDISSELQSASWSQVEKTLEYNLNSYWSEKIGSPDLFLEDEWVEFGVCTVARIIYSIENKEIVSKRNACNYIKDKYPIWGDVLEEALNLRKGNGISAFTCSQHRQERTVAFMSELIEYGNSALSRYR